MKLLVLHLSETGSSEAKVLSSLLAGLDPAIECDVFVNQRTLPGRRSWFAGLDPGRVRVTPVPIGLPPDPWTPRPFATRVVHRATHAVRRFGVLRRARRLRPDVVYTSQQRFDCLMGEIVGRVLRIPHMVHLHYNPNHELRPLALRRLRTCQLVVAISDFIAGQAVVHGVRPDRLAVVHNTLPARTADVVAVEPRRPDRIVIGQSGRMVAEKGFVDTIRAVAIATRRLADVRLVLLGEGPERSRLDAEAAASGLGDRIRFVGWQPDIDPWLESFDLFLHPSRGEPFGLAVLEAARAGVPVVAYADGAAPELLEDGVTGLLARPGDVQQLADHIVRLAEDPELRARMGAAAVERVTTQFRPEDAARHFSALVAALAAGRPAAEVRPAAAVSRGPADA